MKITDMHIIAELERMAAALPWDAVDIWISREPEGKYRFTAYARQNYKMCFDSRFGNGRSPTEAVDDLLKQCQDRVPEIMRERKIAELEDQIRKLQAVVIGLPPYRPNRELSEGEPMIRTPDTVDV